MTVKTDYLSSLRNIGIIAHIDAGKTTLSERILFYTKKIHKMGEVHEGAATMDFMPEEQERGITIASACSTCSWNHCSINLIDTPGHVDFSIEVERSLRVLDGAVGVFCAVGGVEPQSETVWRQAEYYHIPKLVFINKMDRIGASFETVMEEIRVKLGVVPVAVVIPIGCEDRFTGVIDLVTMEKITFDQADQGKTYHREALTVTESNLARPWREKLLECLCDEDDAILETYLDGGNVEQERMIAALRKGTLRRSLVPVFCGSALRNIGVQPLLDGIAAYLPNPAEVEAQQAIDLREGKGRASVPVPVDPNAPFAGLVFKIVMESGRKLAFVRIYSGILREGAVCVNVTREAQEKISRIFRLDADHKEALPEALAGDIVGVQGLRSAVTGDSVCDPGNLLLFEDIKAYVPVISMALEPRNNEEGQRLDEAFSRFTAEDPTVRYETDESTGERIVSGMGELHLEVLLERLVREYGLDVRSGNPQVVCRETIRHAGEGHTIFDKELGGVAHFGDVSVRVEPRERNSGNVVRWGCDRSACSEAWAAEIDLALESSLQAGVVQGFPLQDVLVEVTSFYQKPGQSSTAGYHMAAVGAVKAALQNAGPVLLEPVMRVEVVVPEQQLGSALNALNTRAGKVEDILDRGGSKLIRALAPMRRLFGFSTDLRSATQGRAGLQMRFEQFAIME